MKKKKNSRLQTAVGKTLLHIYVLVDFSKGQKDIFGFPNIGGNISEGDQRHISRGRVTFWASWLGRKMGSLVKHLRGECHHFSKHCETFLQALCTKV